jgi:hypothetical protein
VAGGARGDGGDNDSERQLLSPGGSATIPTFDFDESCKFFSSFGSKKTNGDDSSTSTKRRQAEPSAQGVFPFAAAWPHTEYFQANRGGSLVRPYYRRTASEK